MNDRFKYRVYYKPHNKIYNVVCLNCDRQNEIIIEYKGSTAIVEWKNCEILQPTGLKDKNGKLIYEGDIVAVHRNHLGEHFVGRNYVVKFYKYQYWLFNNGYHPLSNFSYRANQNIEVIGNIYENPNY